MLERAEALLFEYAQQRCNGYTIRYGVVSAPVEKFWHDGDWHYRRVDYAPDNGANQIVANISVTPEEEIRKLAEEFGIGNHDFAQETTNVEPLESASGIIVDPLTLDDINRLLSEIVVHFRELAMLEQGQLQALVGFENEHE
jgi:hypothetical protein